MHILILTATPFEIAPLHAWMQQEFQRENGRLFSRGNLQVEILVSGVGMTATALAIGRKTAVQKPDLLLNAGVCGAIDRKLQPGTVVLVQEECFADLGAEAADGAFLDLFDLHLENRDDFPFSEGKLRLPHSENAAFLPGVSGISVNTVHGTADSIARLRARYPDAQVESMEGAAVFLACLQAGIRFLEIRAVSNYVEPRNRENWNIPLAIDNLNEVLIGMLRSFWEE